MRNHRLIQSIIWLMTYTLMYPILRLVFSIKIKIDDDLSKAKAPILIISNHKSMIDPWIIPIMMPFGVFTKVSPIRFTGATYFKSTARNLLYKIGVIKFIYFIYDVIPLVKKGDVFEKLDPFKKALEEGSAVMFFPEGRMAEPDKIEPFKRGSAALAKITDTDIWPISIKYTGKGWRKRCNIHYGQVFKIPKELFKGDDNPHFLKATAYLEQKVKDLHKSQ